jgi:hypothetical protein
MTHNPEMTRLLELLRNGGTNSHPGLLIEPGFGQSTFNPRFGPRPPGGVDTPGSARGRDSASPSPPHRIHNQYHSHLVPTSGDCGQRYLALPGHHGNKTVCAGRCRIDVVYRAQDKRFVKLCVYVCVCVCCMRNNRLISKRCCCAGSRSHRSSVFDK